MATTDSSKKQRTYAICYGLAGGSLHSRKFRRFMRQAGFVLIEDALKADIIVAHSAGCWLIEKGGRPKLVVYVGMPLTMARRQATWFQANLTDFRRAPIRSAKVRVVNGYYSLSQPHRNIDILRHPKIGQPVIVPKAQAVFIANHYDPWPKTPKIGNFVRDHDWIYINMPGAHDDIWEHPARYVEIISHYA